MTILMLSKFVVLLIALAANSCGMSDDVDRVDELKYAVNKEYSSRDQRKCIRDSQGRLECPDHANSQEQTEQTKVPQHQENR